MPPEIWLRIFELATFVPGVFDTHPPDVFAYPAPLTQGEIHERLRSTMTTKRNLILVCKAWHQLANPLLYQAISITSRSSLQLLLRTLLGAIPVVEELDAVPEPPNSAQMSGYRLLTRRLHLTPRPYESYDGHAVLMLVGALLRLLVNLEILVIRQDPSSFNPFGGDLFLVLKTQKFAKLRVLDVVSNVSRSSAIMPCSPEWPLRVLSIQLFSIPVCVEVEIESLPPSLEALCVPYRPACKILERGMLPPSVTHLSIATDTSVRNGFEAGKCFFLGSNITTLEVYPPRGSTRFYTEHPDMTLEDVVRVIAEACPALRNLVINLRDLWRYSAFKEYFPPVENLGIRFLSGYEAFSVSTLFSAVDQSATERLRVIRVLGEPSRKMLASKFPETARSFQRAASDFLSLYGAQFEDSLGNAFLYASEELDATAIRENSATRESSAVKESSLSAIRKISFIRRLLSRKSIPG